MALPADTLADLYQRQHLSTPAIAERVDTFPDVINRLARDYNIPVRGIGRQTPRIDANWLREQYLVHGRTMTELADEASTAWITLTDYAHRQNIPLRRSDNYYNRRNPATDEEIAAAPRLLCCWRRLCWLTAASGGTSLVPLRLYRTPVVIHLIAPVSVCRSAGLTDGRSPDTALLRVRPDRGLNLDPDDRGYRELVSSDPKKVSRIALSA